MLGFKLKNYLQYRQSYIQRLVQYRQPLTSNPSMCNQFHTKRDINNTSELGIHRKEGTAVYDSLQVFQVLPAVYYLLVTYWQSVSLLNQFSIFFSVLLADIHVVFSILLYHSKLRSSSSSSNFVLAITWKIFHTFLVHKLCLKFAFCPIQQKFLWVGILFYYCIYTFKIVVCSLFLYF